MAAPSSADSSLTDPMNSLFKNAMMGKWEKIVNHYIEDSSCHTQKITRSGDTALNVAVAASREDIVKELLEAISTNAGITKPKEILRIQNNEGNTPLHIAASMGSVAMCEEIAAHDSSLVGVRNSEGETPLFLAAQQGHKDAFLCLTQSCGRKEGYAYCTRTKDGQTVLHSAIFRGHFDLAFQIICLYEDLVNKVNTDGDLPLNILATKPSAFKIGYSLGRWESIIYRCIHVTPLELATSYAKKKTSSLNPQTHRSTWVCFQSPFNVLLLACGRSKADLERQEDCQIRREPTGRTQTQLWSRLIDNIHKAMLVVLGLGHARVNRIKRHKEKHIWSRQVMKMLLNFSILYAYDNSGGTPADLDPEILDRVSDHHHHHYKKNKNEMISSEKRSEKNETAFLTAARNGIMEMVKAILDEYPVAVNDVDADKKNIVLVAVETRQLELYKMLLNKNNGKEHPIHVTDNAFRAVDVCGNSALHLAAKLGENHDPWSIPGEALQMQWEIKWYKFINKSKPPNFFNRYNNDGEVPKKVFTQSHKELVKDGGKWMTKTSQSCSLIAALIATVAFATSTTIPGGTNDKNGKPKLENQLAFTIFGITSLVALFFSVTSLAMFLSILTSRYQQKDFEKSLPQKLLLGLTSLFVSVASIIISFCSGHFFVLGDTLKYAAFPVYALTCLPISFFAAVQFPLYFDLIRATFKNPFGESRRAGKYNEGMQVQTVPLKSLESDAYDDEVESVALSGEDHL